MGLPCSWTLGGMGTITQGANPRGQPFGGVSGVIPPQMAPLILGLLGFGWGVFTSRYSTDFSPIYTDFLGRLFLVIVEVVFTVDYLFTCMFFFQESSSGGIATLKM